MNRRIALILLTALAAEPSRASPVALGRLQSGRRARPKQQRRGAWPDQQRQYCAVHGTELHDHAAGDPCFGGPGLGTQSSARVGACAGGPGAGRFADQAAITRSTSPRRIRRGAPTTASPQATRRSRAGPSPPTRRRLRAISLAPTAAAPLQTVTSPDIFETLTCHQYRTMESTTCDKVLIVTPSRRPRSVPHARVTADPRPACIDYLAYDFTCGTNNHLMHAFTIAQVNGRHLHGTGIAVRARHAEHRNRHDTGAVT